MTLLDDTVGYLREISRHPTAPREALRKLADLRKRHDARIELVWEREPCTERLHYDALIASDAETISVSVCPDEGVPWPLRGLQSWSDSDLLRVDGRVLTIQNAVDLLDIAWSEERLLTRLVDVALLSRERDERGIEDPDPEALQQAVDDFRRERGLLSAGATEAWLSEHGLDLARLEAALADRLIREQIRDQVLGESDEPPSAGFDLAIVTAVDLRSESAGTALSSGSFLDAARHAARTDGAVVTMVEELRRRDLPPSVADAIVSGLPGTVIGPFPWQGGHRVVQILETRRAEADAAGTRLAIREARFTEWLADARRRAHVEWSWGRADPTAVPGSTPASDDR